MSRQRRQRSGLVGRLLVLLILLGIIGGVAYLGPNRALSVGIAGATANFFNRPLADNAHKIPVIDIWIEQKYLDELNADLPWSGGDQKPALLVENGIEHPAKLRYRGVMATTHFLGDKRSFRLTLKRSNPYGPIKRLNLINPKAFNMVNNHLALWVAGQMGVAVPFDELVFVRMNGADYGVMELYEQVDEDFERIRNLADGDVPVFKGDFPSVVGTELPEHLPLWKNAKHWRYEGNADSSIAVRNLRSLVGLMHSDTMPWSMKRDSLSRLIDVDAYLRYCAALKVINTVHIDNYHNQWLVFNQQQKKFYPVMWDALMMFPPVDEPLYYNHDALAYWLLRDPAWRAQRDRYIHQGLKRVYADSLFIKYMDRLMEELRPSVLADRNKFGAVSYDPDDVHQFSSLHYARSADKLKARTIFYWDQLLQQFNSPQLSTSTGDGSMHIAFTSPVAIRVEFPRTEDQKPIIFSGTDTLSVHATANGWSFLVAPEVRYMGAEKESPFTDRTHYGPQPVDRSLTIVGADPNTFLYFNSVTDEPIK